MHQCLLGTLLPLHPACKRAVPLLQRETEAREQLLSSGAGSVAEGLS